MPHFHLFLSPETTATQQNFQHRREERGATTCSFLGSQKHALKESDRMKLVLHHSTLHWLYTLIVLGLLCIRALSITVLVYFVLLRFMVAWLRLRLHQSKSSRIRNESGTFWSRIRFAVYTQNMNPESKLSGFIANPELKVESLYPDTFESEFPCCVNALRIRISWMWWTWKHNSWIRKPLLSCNVV